MNTSSKGTKCYRILPIPKIKLETVNRNWHNTETVFRRVEKRISARISGIDASMREKSFRTHEINEKLSSIQRRGRSTNFCLPSEECGAQVRSFLSHWNAMEKSRARNPSSIVRLGCINTGNQVRAGSLRSRRIPTSRDAFPSRDTECDFK